MSKYTVEIDYKNGKQHVMKADSVNFHAGKGGIDIFEDNQAIPVFPGHEEDVKKITIVINSK